MDNLNFVLSVLAILILVVGLVYTYSLGNRQHKKQGNYDTEINEKVVKHPYLRNPVFLTYALASLFVIFYIIYISINSTW
ncbi:hypothetical protein LCL95_02310 [Bacillus timonensis]|nr:hypothetical protein [Bacillus timonensis]